MIIDHWKDLIRLAGFLKLGHLQAQGVMRILQVRDRPTTLAKALMHRSRLIKTLRILNDIDDADFRSKLARKNIGERCATRCDRGKKNRSKR